MDGAGNVLVADENTGSVSKILPDGTRVSLRQNLDSPGAIAVNETGDVFVATATKLVKIAANGTQATLASVPSWVRKLAFGPDGILYLADSNQGVSRFAGGSLSVVSSQQASSLAIDAAGSFYVTGASTNELYKLAADGTIPIIIPLSFAPVAVAIDGSGIVSVADSLGAIWQLGRSQETITFENTLVGSTSTDSPKALIFDNIGNAASTLTYAQPDRTNDFIAVPGSGSPTDCIGRPRDCAGRKLHRAERLQADPDRPAPRPDWDPGQIPGRSEQRRCHHPRHGHGRTDHHLHGLPATATFRRRRPLHA